MWNYTGVITPASYTQPPKDATGEQRKAFKPQLIRAEQRAFVKGVPARDLSDAEVAGHDAKQKRDRTKWLPLLEAAPDYEHVPDKQPVTAKAAKPKEGESDD